MPTIDLLVQADGFYRGWASLSAGTEGYLMVDDSASTSHDSDSSYLRLRTLASGGIISFPCFRMAEGYNPTSITVTAVGKIDTGVPLLKFGFSDSAGNIGLAAGDLVPDASYNLMQATLNTNPITLAAWTAADLVGLEVLVQMKALTAAVAQITLVSAQMTYTTRVSVGVTHEPIVSQTS